ncbi:hypothetical protein PHMEG_00022936 [Phytophthora megakarya]|uniref:Uncharacterized protein n=1 Tax=Phytophthora megakarya TaxID=4795 RepID=A0A225VJJ0_9STRA|nr:hypothetical protein PHMEG_00022936 [Phytophthora megakarya]
MVMALRPDGPAACLPLLNPLTYQEQHCCGRYLGTYVGIVLDPLYSWEKTDQHRTRIELASRKLFMVEQRSLVVSSVIIPELLYVRQQWPSTITTVNTLERKIKNFVWFDSFTAKLL